jgi:hypothetical protein
MTSSGLPTSDVPAQDDQIACVRAQIKKNLQGYGRSGWRSRLYALSIKFGAATLAGATTVLIAVQHSVPDINPTTKTSLIVISLTTSALVTVLSTFDALLESQWMWLFNYRTRDKISLLLDRFNYSTKGSPALTAARLNEFHSELISIVETANREWAQQRGHQASALAQGSKP